MKHYLLYGLLVAGLSGGAALAADSTVPAGELTLVAEAAPGARAAVDAAPSYHGHHGGHHGGYHGHHGGYHGHHGGYHGHHGGYHGHHGGYHGHHHGGYHGHYHWYYGGQRTASLGDAALPAPRIALTE